MTESGSDGTLRRRILDATRYLLVAEGYASLSMRKIAREIGCSPTAIYLYFQNKDALVHTLIDEGFGLLYEELREEAARHADPVVRLEALWRRYVAFGRRNPEYYEIMFMLHPERMERYPPEKYRRARRCLELSIQALEEGRRQGVFVVENPRVMASAAWAALHGAVALLLARRVDIRIDPEAFIDTTIRTLLRGVLAPDASLQPASK
ncbi:TetR/AcrR family transcriptional regulator [Rhodothermus profundi]|uniref:Transcriptional regulator, TetR family n=1 Tax=Rhodothermus profundi TaxID=633813 RepID=A0A1M6VBG0_9BACT|nr:TetR/AcrR family transcriptional regulator [Rhodothermus profundi]SHK78711.1 transcriptional regulator, TetR family [Rhodothermus profundi]